jgi:Domain of unknown function (DUF4402)
LRPRPHRILKAIAVAACALAGAQPAYAASKVAPVKAAVTKPLTLSWVQNLDLGSVVLGPGTWSNAIVSVSQAGALTCASPNLTCTGATQAASYKVTGSNNEVVRISAPNVTLTNQNDPTQTLTLVVDSPGTVAITTSGKKGTDFSLGGSITLDSTTAGGVYAGSFNVTVDY